MHIVGGRARNFAGPPGVRMMHIVGGRARNFAGPPGVCIMYIVCSRGEGQEFCWPS